MKNKLVELLLVLRLISVCIGVNPCVDYLSVYMVDGLRSSDFDSRQSKVSICDYLLDPATWYRFDHDAGNRLIERPVEPGYCGTQAPIWMNGSHPTDRSDTTASVCATFTSENICGWNGTVRIRLCNESGSEYFVYLLAVPPDCASAYCVDAASRKQCIPPDVWLQDEFRCGVSGTSNSTVPLTEVTTLTTSATIVSSSAEHQSLTPTLRPSTEPASSGWNTWGPWSVCSKPCDYGYQSRRRTCDQPPCEGQANDEQLCNEYNCHKLPDEKTRGTALVFQSPETQEEDTMLTFVLNQPEIHDILRKNINDICSQNVSLCCGWQYNGISPLDQEFVQPSDIYPAQGSLEPKSENTVYCQIIAIVNEDIDREICNGHSQQIHARQVESSQNFLSFDVMLMASEISSDNISQETGLIVIEYIDPATTTEDDDEEDEVSCPSLTCVLPIVICVTIVATAAVIGGLCFAKSKLKSKTEPEAPSPEPPQYEDVLSTDLRVNIKELPYIIGLPLPTDVSHNDYNTHVDQGSLDFQKIYLDVLSKKL